MPVVEPGHFEIVEKLIELVVGHGEITPAGLVAQGPGQMGFPGAGRTEKEDVLPLANELSGSQGLDPRGVDGGVEVEVEGFQGVVGADLCLADQPMKLTFPSQLHLVVEQQGEELGMGKLVSLRFEQAEFQDLGDTGEFQGLELLLEIDDRGHGEGSPVRVRG